MFPEIETNRLTLRAFRCDDLEVLCTLLDNYEVSKMLSVVPYPYTKADGEWWLEHCSTTPHSEELNWAIESDGAFCGTIGLRFSEENSPLLGYWLGEPYWGKGYMSEAAEAVIAYCFQQLGVAKVISGAFEENFGSQNVLAKNGFQTIGSRPDKSVARGEDGDVVLIEVELTRHLWEAMQAVQV